MGGQGARKAKQTGIGIGAGNHGPEVYNVLAGKKILSTAF
jgi:hypothetical protein